MKLRAAALSLAILWAAPTLALADAKVEGLWKLDVKSTVAETEASNKLPPDAIKQMATELTAMGEKFSLSFAGSRLTASTGDNVTSCDWSWANGNQVVPVKCIDKNGKPNDLDPAREVIELKDGALHLIDKESGLALIFRRG